MLGISPKGWGIVAAVGLADSLVSIAWLHAGAGVIPFSLLSSVLATSAMALVARDTARSPRSQWFALFVLGFWVEYASSLVEAIAFDVIPMRAAAAGLLVGASLTLPLAWVASTASTASVAEETRASHGRAVGAWAWRGVVAVLVFVVAYFTAGAIVYPFVREFYAGRPIPAMGSLFALQALRGSVLVGVTLPLLARARSQGAGRALRWAVVLVVLAGVAPLVTPNPVFPDHVRFAHMVEVVGSHLVIGATFAMLLGRRSATRREPPVS